MAAVLERSDPYHLMYVGRSSTQINRDFGARLEELADQGFDVHVLAAPDGGFTELADRGIHCKRLPVGYRGNLPGLAGAFFIIQAYFLEHRPVLVHGHDGLLAWMTAMAGSYASVPAIFATVEGYPLPGSSVGTEGVGSVGLRMQLPRLVEALESRLERLVSPLVTKGEISVYQHLARLVDKYIVTTEREFEALEAADWLPSNKLEMVVGGRGVDLDAYTPEGDDGVEGASGREPGHMPDHWRRVVGYVGSLRADRGGLDLLRVIDRMSEQRRDAGWLICPLEGVPSSVETKLEHRAERGDVRLYDGLDDPSFYRLIDLYAYPRGEHRASSGMMKAQAMRLPVVAYDTPGAATVVANGHTGRLVPAGDVDEFTRTVRGLLDDPKRCRDFGVRARARTTQRFNRRDVDEQVMRLYDTVLEEQLG